MATFIERQENGTRIRLDGECTIGGAAELKAALVEAMALTGSVELDLAQVEQIDITMLQLLWAARRAFEDRGLAFELRDISPNALSIAEQAGFRAFPGRSAGV